MKEASFKATLAAHCCILSFLATSPLALPFRILDCSSVEGSEGKHARNKWSQVVKDGVEFADHHSIAGNQHVQDVQQYD